MSNQNDRLDFKSSYDEGEESKFVSKVKQNPFVPVGNFNFYKILFDMKLLICNEILFKRYCRGVVCPGVCRNKAQEQRKYKTLCLSDPHSCRSSRRCRWSTYCRLHLPNFPRTCLEQQKQEALKLKPFLITDID